MLCEFVSSNGIRGPCDRFQFSIIPSSLLLVALNKLSQISIWEYWQTIINFLKNEFLQNSSIHLNRLKKSDHHCTKSILIEDKRACR